MVVDLVNIGIGRWCIWPYSVKTFNIKNTGKCRCFLFWWERVESNHLSHKTTDLQSAPALRLRRAPRTIVSTMVRAAGLEPAHQAWKACVLALVLCPQ